MSITDALGGRRPGWPARLALITALVLCWSVASSAGQVTETQHETPDMAGVSASVGSMVLDDVHLEAATTVPTVGSVPLRAALTDNPEQPDRLLAVSAPAAASVELLDADGTPSPGGIDVPAEGSVDAATGPVRLRLTGLTGPLDPLGLVRVTFVFEHAGRVTVGVPTAPPQQ